MPVELMSAIDEANAMGILHHARRGQHREEQVESSDVSSNTKRRMPWSAISQCRLRRLRLRP